MTKPRKHMVVIDGVVYVPATSNGRAPYDDRELLQCIHDQVDIITNVKGHLTQDEMVRLVAKFASHNRVTVVLKMLEDFGYIQRVPGTGGANTLYKKGTLNHDSHG